MGIKETKKYLIVSKSTGKALDWNTKAAQQLAPTHPRIFHWNPTPTAHNHHWVIAQQGNGNYVIYTGDKSKALDGNVKVAQVDASHPHPFLWNPSPNAANHRWRFEKVGKKTYVIINESNGLALDGNTADHVPNHDKNYRAPFLWTPNHGAVNHQWELRKV